MTFRDIIGLWPSPDALATEIGAKAETVRKWRQRNSIPAEYWLRIISAAKRGGVDITTDELTAAIDKEPSDRPAAENAEAAA